MGDDDGAVGVGGADAGVDVDAVDVDAVDVAVAVDDKRARRQEAQHWTHHRLHSYCYSSSAYWSYYLIC